MEKLILVVHLLTAVAIIGMILLQQGKGAEAGASFGSGASQTLFGSSGSWNFFSKATALLAALFFVTSLTLAVMARNNAGIGSVDIPAMEILDAESQLLMDEAEIPSFETESSDLDAVEIPGVPELDSQLPSEQLPIEE